MQIKKIVVYPIKSLGGVEVTSVALELRGLALDRRWMLVDEEGNFITQRVYPELALFQVTIFSTELVVLNRKSQEEVTIPFVPQGQSISVRVWNDSIEAMEVSPVISEWFSRQLKKQVHLVYMTDKSKRQIDQKYAPSVNDVVSFADGYPLLISNIASLQDLNKRLSKSVSMNRFRPNIVVDGSNPYEEDDWRTFKTPNTKMVLVKRCSRCVMVNIDPETAEKGTEVLAELSNYRKANNKVYFGVNAIPTHLGVLKVGDTVTVA